MGAPETKFCLAYQEVSRREDGLTRRSRAEMFGAPRGLFGAPRVPAPRGWAYQEVPHRDVWRTRSKKWHMNFMEKAPRAKSVFEGIHRPKRRISMLESLFIKNITEVLSTGEINPEILGYNVEINGVKMSPCYKTLNVYWQVPPSSFEKHEEIAVALNACAPRLRAELISRNVMGKVPYIFFIRDLSNARLADFENALKDADLGPENERSVIPDDEFLKEILVFKDTRNSKMDKKDQEEVKNVKSSKKPSHTLPQRPSDMKSDVFGLKYDIILNKILASRGRMKVTENSAVISSEYFPSAELFDKIPGTTLQPGIDRSKLLKQFQIERKIARNKNRNAKVTKEDSLLEEDVPGDYAEYKPPDYQDYIEEESPESSFH